MTSTTQLGADAISCRHLSTTLCAMRWMARMLGRRDIARIADELLDLPWIGAHVSDMRRLQKTLDAQRLIALLNDRKDALVAIDLDLRFVSRVLLKQADHSLELARSRVAFH